MNRLYVLSMLEGVLLFIMEFALSYLIQLFLLTIGVSATGPTLLADWIPQDNLYFVLTALISITMVRGALQWSVVYIQGATQERFRFNQRENILKNLFQGREANTGHLTMLFGERAHQGGQALFFSQSCLVYAVSALLLGAALFVISPRMSIFCALCTALLFLCFQVLAKVAKRSARVVGNEWRSLNDRFTAAIRNLLFIRISAMEQGEYRAMHNSLFKYRSHMLRSYFIEGFLYSMPQIMGMGLTCAVAYWGMRYQRLSPGSLLAYIYILLRTLQNLAVVLSTGSNFIMRAPQVGELFSWWKSIQTDTPPAFANNQKLTLNAIENTIPSKRVGWKFNEVTFAFENGRPLYSAPLNLTIKPGSTLVVTGPSGSGKSTLLNLLVGEFHPTSGTIQLDLEGELRPLAELRRALLGELGYMGPEPFLLDGSIRENLLYGVPTPQDPEELQRALELAQCQFITQLSNGLDHRITEQGDGLSAGQKQRLMLARAILRHPKVLILDEPSANLDEASEMTLISTLKKLQGTMTLIIVTHRKSLLTLADTTLDLGQSLSLDNWEAK